MVSLNLQIDQEFVPIRIPAVFVGTSFDHSGKRILSVVYSRRTMWTILVFAALTYGNLVSGIARSKVKVFGATTDPGLARPEGKGWTKP